MYRDGVPVPNAMIMSQEFNRAEHYFPVELEKNTRARNWFETTGFANSTRLTWVDMHYTYTQPEAHVSWMGSTRLDSEGDIEPVILRYTGPENYSKYLGFPYDHTVNDIRDLITPSVAINISYDEAHFTDGLILNETTRLEYTSIIDIQETFSLTFRLKVDSTSSNDQNLVTLIGPNRNYIKIYTFEGKLYCRCSDHKDLIIPYKRATAFDFLTFGFNQTATERSLYFFADYANFESNETVEATPTGRFTKYYINRKLGEDL
jgi:hypothetical protein